MRLEGVKVNQHGSHWDVSHTGVCNFTAVNLSEERANQVADEHTCAAPKPETFAPKYQIMVCTRCWVRPEDLKPHVDIPSTAQFEDGVFYVTPHKPDCRQVAR